MTYAIKYATYIIRNKVNNKCYVGVDSRYPSRIKFHKRMLLRGDHPNKHLQSSYNKHGLDNFSFELVSLYDTREEALNKEVELIKKEKSMLLGYNHTSGGEGAPDYTHTKESIKKMSSWERNVDKAWLKQLSKARDNRKPGFTFKKSSHPDYSKWIGGEKHPVAKLKQVDVYNIRLRFLNKERQVDLAKEYGISHIQINYIVRNISWVDSNYEYIKRNTFSKNIYTINNLKKYLNEKIHS